MLDPCLDLAAEGLASADYVLCVRQTAEGFTATLRRSVVGSSPDVRVVVGPTFTGAASTAEQAMAAAIIDVRPAITRSPQTALAAAIINLDDPPTL